MSISLSKVQQVSDMFRDLAVMVSDQGQQISSVENSVDTTVRDSKGEMMRFSLN